MTHNNKLFATFVLPYLAIVNGNWGEWTGYEACTASCGGGYQYRMRLCDSPKAQDGGLTCLLSDNSGYRSVLERTSRQCNAKPCPGKFKWSSTISTSSALILHLSPRTSYRSIFTHFYLAVILWYALVSSSKVALCTYVPCTFFLRTLSQHLYAAKLKIIICHSLVSSSVKMWKSTFNHHLFHSHTHLLGAARQN